MFCSCASLLRHENSVSVSYGKTQQRRLTGRFVSYKALNSDTLIFSGNSHLGVVQLNAVRSLLLFISNVSMGGVVIVDHRQKYLL